MTIHKDSKITFINYKYVFIITLVFLISCTSKIERKGIVVDSGTNKPIENVTIDIYLRHLKNDSLQEKAITDEKGYFHITEKRSKDLLFDIEKEGYISFVSTISRGNDTIKLERSTD